MNIVNMFEIPYNKLMLRRSLTHAYPKGVTCEIGTSHGINAKLIMKHLKPEKLYLIDPVKTKEVTDMMDWHNPYWHEFDNKMKKIYFIQKLSENAIDDIPANLDNLYIDGDHSYKGCKKDLENFVPKVIDGGFVGGHDWHHPEVAKAVIEFCNKNDYELFISDYVVIPNWYFYKRRK